VRVCICAGVCVCVMMHLFFIAIALCSSVMQCNTVCCCSMLQHVAACCSMLQCVATCCSVLQRLVYLLLLRGNEMITPENLTHFHHDVLRFLQFLERIVNLGAKSVCVRMCVCKYVRALASVVLSSRIVYVSYVFV